LDQRFVARLAMFGEAEQGTRQHSGATRRWSGDDDPHCRIDFLDGEGCGEGMNEGSAGERSF
jgi:hypothetical protein